MSTKRLHICIDCGGSKTAAALSTLTSSGPSIVSRGTAGPSNYKDNGLKVFISAIRTATMHALHNWYASSENFSASQMEDDFLPTVEAVLASPRGQAEFREVIGDAGIYSVWIGASGVDAIQDINTLEPLLSKLFRIPVNSGRLMIANDAHIFASPLLTSKTGATSAVVAIAGTGSVVISFEKHETTGGKGYSIRQLSRAGGWGYILGDDGAGFFAGREAVREVLKTFEEDSLWEKDITENKRGGKESDSLPQAPTLTSLVLDHFGVASPDEPFSVVYAPDPPPAKSPINTPSWALIERKQRLVTLAPLVFKAAFELGDPTAMRALRTSVGGLADQIAFLSQPKKERPGAKMKAVTANESILSLGGSLFSVQKYRDLLVEELKARGRVFCEVVYVDDAARDGADSIPR